VVDVMGNRARREFEVLARGTGDGDSH